MGCRLVCMRIELFAVQRDTDRPSRDLREQRSLRLDGHVLAAAEGAAIGHQFDEQPVFRNAKHRRDLRTVIEYPLPLAVEMQTSVRFGDRQGRFRFEIKLFDTLRPPGAGHHMRGRRKRRLCVAAFDVRHLQHIVVLGVDLRRPRLDRFRRIDHGGPHVVFDLYELGRGARNVRAVGGDGGNTIGNRASLLALGDEAWPILVDEADPAVARHILGRCDGGDARQRERLRHVNPLHQRPRVARQHDYAMQQPRRIDVGDEMPRAERQFATLVALERSPDASIQHGRGQRAAVMLGGMNQLDGVDDLRVAGTSAQMSIDGACDLGARQRTNLIRQPFGAQHDTRRAKPALQTGGSLERIGIKLPLVVGDAFEGDDRPADDFVGFNHAGILRLAVNERQATAAQTLRRTRVLDRRYLEHATQQIEQRLLRLHFGEVWRPIELEGN